MAIKSVGYPIMVDLGNDAGAVYSVYVDNELVFAGRSIERNIDLAPLLRDYLNSERIIIDRPAGDGIANATPQLSAGAGQVIVKSSGEGIRIDVAFNSVFPFTTADLIPVGYNLRGKVLLFTGRNKSMDSPLFTDEGRLFGASPNWGDFNLRAEAVDPYYGENAIMLLTWRAEDFDAQYWRRTSGWQQIIYQFPNNQDFIVSENTLNPHLTNGWGWSDVLVLDSVPDDPVAIMDTFFVANDYNEDCKTDFPGEPSITSEFIRNEIDRRQIAFLGANSALGSMTYDITCRTPGTVISMDKIVSGMNIRGMTIEFTNTDKRVPPVVPPEDDPDFTGYGLLTGSVGEPTWGIGYLNFGGTLIAATGDGGDFDPIFLDNIAEGGEYDQVWLKTVVTVPDDKDHIVVKNDLPAHKGDDWGFDYATSGEEGESESTSETYEGPSTIVRTTIDLPNANSLSFAVNGSTLMDLKISPCAKYRYALYAVNRKGGITHIVCEGKPLESYQKTNWDIDTDYNRLSEVGRGSRRMSVTSTRRWRLNTGYLTESEAKHIDDLVTSPRIVLHDLEAGRLFAVNSNDSTIERRTRVSNGRRPIEYTLTFEEARIEIRR